MPEFTTTTTIYVPYRNVWRMASVIENIEKWAPVEFKTVAPEERVRNGLKLLQKKKQFGVFACKHLVVKDAYTNSMVRRQYAFVDEEDKYGFNRITYTFDDNSIQTMIDLCDDEETLEVLKEQAKSEPQYQVDIKAHVFYTFGSKFWRSFVESVFITPFFRMFFLGRVKKSLAKLKELSENMPDDDVDDDLPESWRKSSGAKSTAK